MAKSGFSTSLQNFQKKPVIGLTFILIFILFVSLVNVPYQPPGGILNSNPEGASIFAEMLNEFNMPVSRLLYSPLFLKQSNNHSILFIIGGSRIYSASEIQFYSEFVSKGNVLVIFDNQGTSRAIAEHFGIIFLGGVVKETDEQRYFRSPDTILVEDSILKTIFPDSQLNPILVSRANGLVEREFLFSGGLTDLGSYPILVTSDTSILDRNNNNVIDANDYGPNIPIGWLKEVGNGSVIVFSTPTLVLNEYTKLLAYSNLDFMRLLISFLIILYPVTSFIFDESHLNPAFLTVEGFMNTIIGSWLTMVTSSYFLVFITGLAILSLTAYYGRQKNFSRKKRGQLSTPLVATYFHPTSIEQLFGDSLMLSSINLEGFLLLSLENRLKILLEHKRTRQQAQQLLSILRSHKGTVPTRVVLDLLVQTKFLLEEIHIHN